MMIHNSLLAVKTLDRLNDLGNGQEVISSLFVVVVTLTVGSHYTGTFLNILFVCGRECYGREGILRCTEIVNVNEVYISI